jgi:uncharacterized protein
MSKIFSAISCNPDTNLINSALPLFQAEKVEAIEWSFDTISDLEKIPEWFTSLLRFYSNEDRLTGHGVFFSLFSAAWTADQQQWLNNLKILSSRYKFSHITEHFGFMTGADFHNGAPLPVPFNSSTLKIGQDRLKRIYNHCHCPVGIENLAFSFSAEDVKIHAEFLSRLVEPVNGFLILDLHNLWCQAFNFRTDPEILFNLYPLDLVREIHISGGSWDYPDESATRIIRRDTHDNKVPDEVFTMLKYALSHCRNLKFVVMEQLGAGLETEQKRTDFRNDYFTMQSIVSGFNSTTSHSPEYSFLPENFETEAAPVTNEELYNQQILLSEILENAGNSEEAFTAIHKHHPVFQDWHIERWDADMLTTAIKIAKKWKKKQP